jgi:hypothetical protein
MAHNASRKCRYAVWPWKSRDVCNVYGYFDNDAKVKAPFDAMKLRWRLQA